MSYTQNLRIIMRWDIQNKHILLLCLLMTKEWNYLMSCTCSHADESVGMSFSNTVCPPYWKVVTRKNMEHNFKCLSALFTFILIRGGKSKRLFKETTGGHSYIQEYYISTQWPPFISKEVVPAFLYHSQCGWHQWVIWILFHW